MKSRLKNVYFEMFVETLELDKKLNLSEPQRRTIANLLANQAVHVHDANFDILKEEHQNITKDQEKTRAQFIGFINFIEKSTKLVMDNFKKHSLVKVEFDAVKRKAVMKPRTSVVEEMVVFLNKMNDLVIKFYEDVYKIDLVDEKDINKDQIQGSLF